MSKVHQCALPRKDTSGLPKLPPNASLCKQLCRKLRKLVIVNPKSFKCKFFSNNKSVIMAEQRRHIRSPYSYMIHPLSTLSSFLEISFFVLWLSKMVAEPVLGNMVEKPKILQYIDFYPIVTLQRALIIAFFFMGYMDTKTKEIVIEHKRVAKRYVRTFFFVDMFASELSVMISLALKYIYKDEMDDMNVLVKVADRVHIMFLYARLHTILTFLGDIAFMLNIKKRMRKCVIYLLRTFMYLHLCCCILYYIPQLVYDTDWPSDSWFVMAKISPKQEHRFFKKYAECLLTTASYFFGASAGKYDIMQTNEQICLIIITLFGRLYTLFLLADVLNTFGISEISESRYEGTMAELKGYMMHKNLPRMLENRIVRYYECKMQRHYFDEEEILSSLSENLRTEIYLFSARMLMQKSNFFKYLPEHEVVTLISMMNLVTYAPGDVLFADNANNNDIYFISSGCVAIININGVELCHLEDGEAFGLCRHFTSARQLKAVTVETSDVFLINSDVFFGFLREYPQAMMYLKARSCERDAFYRNQEVLMTRMVQTCHWELKTGKLLEKKKRRVFVE